MNRKWILLFSSIICLSLLFACNKGADNSTSNGSSKKDKTVTLKVGAASIPHAEVLEYLKEDLKKDGVLLDIKTGLDGIQIN